MLTATKLQVAANMAPAILNSSIFTGSNATISPSGSTLAFRRERNIGFSCIENDRQIPSTFTNISPNDITKLKWSQNEENLLIVSDRGAEIVPLESDSHIGRCKLQNGSGSLGRLVSVDFVGEDVLLSIWEFGKAKLWDLNSGKSIDLPDAKTGCDFKVWQMRLGVEEGGTTILAMLSRTGADDHLIMHIPVTQKSFPWIKLPTVDAQGLLWSPDGRWLAVQDTATARPSVHLYTPDGCHFRSYPSSKDSEIGLGVKRMAWSSDSSTLALARYDGRIDLLNTKTFSPIAFVEPTTTIDQRSLPVSQQATIWQEKVSAANERSYTKAPQPTSPPLSRTGSSVEPQELGVAELCFSCDGNTLATRDYRMLNTIWLWSMETLSIHTVLIQHSNVRRLTWHPTKPDTLLIDCGESFAYVHYTSLHPPPLVLPTDLRPKAILSWIIPNTPNAKPMILVTEKQAFQFLYPEGQAEEKTSQQKFPMNASMSGNNNFDEGGSEDSLFDVLSGRKPLPPKTEPSYAEAVAVDVDADADADADVDVDVETETVALDDTFREKRKGLQGQRDLDPLDDSQIF